MHASRKPSCNIHESPFSIDNSLHDNIVLLIAAKIIYCTILWCFDFDVGAVNCASYICYRC